MDNEKLMGYMLAMMMAKKMLSAGIIDMSEYTKIEEKMCEKYGINICSFFRELRAKRVDKSVFLR